jgi:hypothetical protein
MGGPDDDGGYADDAGASSQGSPADGLYDLSQVPEHLHDHVLPIAKQIEGNVTKRFQEAADYRKRWEPYEQVGLDEFEPTAIEQLLTIGHLAQDEDQFNEWLLQTAEARELLEPEGPEGEYDDEEGYGEEYGEQSNGLTPDHVQQMIGDALEQALGPIAGRFQADDEQRRLQETSQQIDGLLDEIDAEHQQHSGGEINRDRILQLSLAYTDQGLDGIRQGYEDWKADRTETERGMFESKRGAPMTPETGGRATTSSEAPQSFEEAAEAAKAIMRRSRAG